MMLHTRARRGFTLVEILVAIALGLVLLGIAVAVSQSSAFASYKIVGTADRLSQWMLSAKNKALRDKAPRGIRLLPDPNNGNFVREIAYIEQPDPWIPAANVTITATSPRLVVQRVVPQSPPQGAAPMGGVDTTRVFLINADPTGIITTGDLLYLPEVGQSYAISALTPNPGATSDFNPPPPVGTSSWPPATAANPVPNITWQNSTVFELVLAPTPVTGTPPVVASPNQAVQQTDLGQRFGAGFAKTDLGGPFTVAGTWHTTNFAVYRQPRLVMGEPTQLLPAGMAIDVTTGVSLNPPAVNASGGRDILFAPSGEIVGVADGVIALTVRDTALSPTVTLNSQASLQQAGQVILVCTYPKTGAIGTQPNNPPPVAPPANFDPFQFAKDGINTGL